MKIIGKIKEDFRTQTQSLVPFKKLNQNGLDSNTINQYFKDMKSILKSKYIEGKMSGAYYSNNQKLNELILGLVPYFSKSNPLHVNVYPAIRKMENE